MAVALAQGIEFRRIRGFLLGGLMAHQTSLTVQTLLTDSASCPLPDLAGNPQKRVHLCPLEIYLVVSLVVVLTRVRLLFSVEQPI
jgi:hypothetical protein